MKVSFSGIYDVRFPYGTSDYDIEEKYKYIKDYTDKNYNSNLELVEVAVKDRFNIQRTDKKLADKGIRISTAVDNPYILCDIFDKLDKNLGQQYVDKSKVELVLDTKA